MKPPFYHHFHRRTFHVKDWPVWCYQLLVIRCSSLTMIRAMKEAREWHSLSNNNNTNIYFLILKDKNRRKWVSGTRLLIVDMMWLRNQTSDTWFTRLLTKNKYKLGQRWRQNDILLSFYHLKCKLFYFGRVGADDNEIMQWPKFSY